MKPFDHPIHPETLLENAGWMKALARSLVADDSAAEDVVQETWLTVLEHPPRHGSGLRSWIATVLRNVARRARRGEKRRERRERLGSRPEKLSLTPEDLVERAEVHRRLVDLVVGLREPYRSTVLLRFFEGLTPGEIARLEGAPVSTVRTRILRGLELLRTALDQAYGKREVWSAIVACVAGTAVASGLGTAARAAGRPAASAHALGNTLTGGALMTLTSKHIMVAAAAALAVTALGLGLKLSDARRENERLQGLVDSASPENAGRSRTRDPEPPGAAAGRGDGDAGRAAARPPGAGVDPRTLDGLASKAIGAYETKDPRAFNDAFFELIDLGPPAYETLFHVLRSTTGDNSVRMNRLGEECLDEFGRKIRERAGNLSPLLDAIISRPGDPDGAYVFALYLMQFYGVRSHRPPEEHAIALLDVMSRCLGSPEAEWKPGESKARIFGWTGQLLGHLRLEATLPALERMLLSPAASDANKVDLFGTMAKVGGEAGVQFMERAFEGAPEFLRSELLRNVGRIEDKLVIELVARLSAGREDAELRRDNLRHALRDPERLAEIFERLRGDELGAADGLELIGALYKSDEPEHRDVAWEAFQRLDPRSQESALEDDFVRVEPRAVSLLVERLSSREEPVSDSLRRAYRRLDSKLVREHEDAFRRAAGSPELPLETRAAAASGLVKIDPRAAVDSVTAGFATLDEETRRRIARLLRNELSCGEAKAFLASVAANDPAESVREAAAR